MKIRNITYVYRQEAGAEDVVVSGTPAEEEPPVETPPVEAAPTETPPSETPPVDDGDDHLPEETSLWESLSREIDEDDLPEVDVSPPPSVEEPLAPQPPVEGETPPPAEPPAETPPAVEPEVTPPVVEVTPPVEQPPIVTPEPAITQVPSPEALAQVDAQKRQDMQAKIANHYPLSEEDSLQLLSDPGKFLPKYQARMWTDMWYAIEGMLQKSMPALVQTNLREVEEQKTKVDTFLKVWPKLSQEKHGKVISQISTVYSQVNPTATEEEITKFVGMQAMLHFGIAPDLAPVETGSNSETPPATPPATPVPPPFQPAAVNAVSAVQVDSDDLWGNMSRELDEEDRN